jgi:hypothetical protein
MGKPNRPRNNVAPKVNRRCAGALLEVLDFALGVNETEPDDETFAIVASFTKNLNLEIARYDAIHDTKRRDEISSKYSGVQEALKVASDDE